MEQHYWESKYTNKQTGWDLGIISPPLKAYIDQLNSKNLKILVPGCGNGHEITYLSESGFTSVTALDFVAAPLEKIKAKYPDIHTEIGDIFTFQGKFDLILEQTLFCAINPTRRKEYVQKISSLLKPNGKFVGVLFNRDFEQGPPFGGSVAEYETYFNQNFTSFEMETCYNSIKPRANTEVFFIARK